LPKLIALSLAVRQHRAGLVGKTVMRRLGVAVLFGALASCSAGTDIPVAEKAVARFHMMLDAGQNAQIYQESASEMKSAAPKPSLPPCSRRSTASSAR
jgi:hypothetical protein